MKTIMLAQASAPSRSSGSLILRPVSQLETLPDGSWRSLGHDPYFEMRGPFEPGWYRATWSMGADFAMPVTFFIQFAAPRHDCVSVRCGQSERTPGGHRSHLFRLGHPVRCIQVQPCSRPGPFTFGDFRWSREEPPPEGVLYPMRDLVATTDGWRSLGSDPAFECACALDAGFYRLRWTATAGFRLSFKVYYGSDGNFSEAKAHRISGGAPGIRTEYSLLVHIPEQVTHLQIHPCEQPGDFEMGDFAIAPESPPPPGHLYPRQQIELVTGGDGRAAYRSLGVDPAFEIDEPMAPGWYDLSWVASASFPLDARVYFGRRDEGFSESAAAGWAPVICQEERRFRHRVRLEEPFDLVQLHPTPDRVGFFTLRDFRIRRQGSIRNWLLDRAAPKVSTKPRQSSWFSDYLPTLARRAEAERDAAKWRLRPKVSIVMPVFDPHERYLREAIESVRAQTWSSWELCIADDASRSDSVRDLLGQYAAIDPRIRVVHRQSNGHIAAATNSALEIATGEFVGFLDQDDCLHPLALHDVVELLQESPSLDAIYTDEDKVDEMGRHVHPVFKPDWAPDSLLARMYVGHFLVARRDLVASLGMRTAYSGSQDYDLVLRIAERTQAIGHVARVRYHWRAHRGSSASGVGDKWYAFENGRLAIADALARRGETGSVHHIAGYPGQYEVRPALPSSPLVSIIVPFRDQLDLTHACVCSILQRTSYGNYEIVLVDNGSEPQAIAAFERQWRAREPQRVRVVSWNEPFNFSILNNATVDLARGEFLLFLNNDTEVISPDWLERMLAQALRPGIGAVGAKLLYGNGTVQHAGVILGVGGVAGHAHRHLDRDEPGSGAALKTVTNYSAVTGACMMCRREAFDAVGRFDPRLGIAFNDVDLCLRFLDAGYRNVYVPVELFHFESRSRGAEDSPQKQQRFEGEQRLMVRRWGARIRRDPFYNPNFSRLYENFSYDPALPDIAEAGRVELDIPRRVVLHGADRTVRGRCSFLAGAGPQQGWFYLDGVERGRLDFIGACEFRFTLQGDLADGDHALEVLVCSEQGTRAVASLEIDIVQADVPEQELERVAALRRVVPFDLPLQAYVEVTTACNLACVMCRFDVKGKDVATNLYLGREVFERLGPMLQALRVVHLYGWGEPTLHPEYIDFIRHVRSRNMDCRVVFTSNFNNISDKLMSVFIEEKVDMINVSIDGASAAVYEDIRRRGSFEKLLASLDAFAKKKERYQSSLPHLQYELVVQRGNVHELPAFVDLIRGLGGSAITFEHVCGMPHLEIDYREWLPTFERAEEHAGKAGIRLVGSAVTKFREVAGRVCPPPAIDEGGGPICHEPFQTLYVNPEGTVSPCCMHRAVLGDLRESSVEEIWFGRAYNDFRENIVAGRLDAQCMACVAQHKNQARMGP